MSKRQIRMLLMALLLPTAFAAFVMLAIFLMTAALVPVNIADARWLWPIVLLIAGPAYVIMFWWLIGNWRADKTNT